MGVSVIVRAGLGIGIVPLLCPLQVVRVVCEAGVPRPLVLAVVRLGADVADAMVRRSDSQCLGVGLQSGLRTAGSAGLAAHLHLVQLQVVLGGRGRAYPYQCMCMRWQGLGLGVTVHGRSVTSVHVQLQVWGGSERGGRGGRVVCNRFPGRCVHGEQAAAPSSHHHGALIVISSSVEMRLPSGGVYVLYVTTSRGQRTR